MRITLRNSNNKDYWTKRWADIPADIPMENDQVYPLKYAKQTVRDKAGKILEAGCGAGRIIRYYHKHGYDIAGIDFIKVAVDKLNSIDPSLNVEVGDIMQLEFPDESFRYVLAFGLFHNLESGLDKAIQETHRVMEKDGVVCASFRADNIQTRFTDWLTERRSRKHGNNNSTREFHKLNLTRREFEEVFRKAGFTIESISAVENMPFLYKFSVFRRTDHKHFDENKARSEGYCLSWMGHILQNILMRFLPDQFCNIYVLIARKSN